MSKQIEIDKDCFEQVARNKGSDRQDIGTGEIIRRIRKERGLSAKEFAARIGTSGAQIMRLEKGQRRLTDIWLNRIAKGLDVTINDLLSEAVLQAAIAVTYVAGAVEGDEVSKSYDTPLKLPGDSRFPDALRYGVLIGENHAGGRFAQGSIVICAPLGAINEAMTVGTSYHVRIRGNDGFLSLICELQQDPSGRLWLVPETHNPSIKNAMPHLGTADEASALTGRVIGTYAEV